VSSFSVSGTGVTFDALEDGFMDRGGALEEITVSILVASSTEWGALFSLRSWDVTAQNIPGGEKVYVDIGGGAGVGSLNIDNLDSHQAILIELSRDFVEPGSLRSRAKATWWIVG
jgi:hypothetical protein